MYSEPCARLIMSMMPNTSVRPAASRNSIRPSCKPFSTCSTIRESGIRTRDSLSRHCERSEAIQGVRGLALDRFVATLLAMTCSLHLAARRERIRVVGEHFADRLVGDPAAAVLDDFAQVVVLDRKVVG